MTDTLSGIVWILYIVLGYWSVGQTIYANKIIIGPMGTLWIKRFILGFMFGCINSSYYKVFDFSPNKSRCNLIEIKMQRIGKWGCKKEFQIAKLLVLGSF